MSGVGAVLYPPFLPQLLRSVTTETRGSGFVTPGMLIDAPTASTSTTVSIAHSVLVPQNLAPTAASPSPPLAVGYFSISPAETQHSPTINSPRTESSPPNHAQSSSSAPLPAGIASRVASAAMSRTLPADVPPSVSSSSRSTPPALGTLSQLLMATTTDRPPPRATITDRDTGTANSSNSHNHRPAIAHEEAPVTSVNNDSSSNTVSRRRATHHTTSDTSRLNNPSAAPQSTPVNDLSERCPSRCSSSSSVVELTEEPNSAKKATPTNTDDDLSDIDEEEPKKKTKKRKRINYKATSNEIKKKYKKLKQETNLLKKELFDTINHLRAIGGLDPLPETDEEDTEDLLMESKLAKIQAISQVKSSIEHNKQMLKNTAEINTLLFISVLKGNSKNAKSGSQ